MIQLLTLLGGSLTAIISAVIALLGRKWATAASAIGLFVVMTAAMIACINTILAAAVAFLVMPGWLASAVGMFVPSGFAACVGAIVSAKTCRAAYDLAMAKADTFAKAS